MKVCVLGGGPGGVEAAAEAARSGSEVTLIEKSSALPPARAQWPSLIEKARPTELRDHLLRALGVEVVLGATVTSLGPHCLVYGNRSGAKFDRVVIATGSGPARVVLPGLRKPGVRVLGRAADYLDLAECRSSISRCVVSGSGAPAFQIAEGLQKYGANVTILGRGQTSGGLCRAVGELLEVRAFEKGMRVRGLRLQKAVGSGVLEAVVGGGKVITCDTLVLLPAACPEYPPGSPKRGPHEGIVVDEQMRSAEPDVFAAGSCAEMATAEAHSTLPLDTSAIASGRVAGASSSGRSVTLKAAGAFSADVFGIWLERAGLTSEMASRVGLKVVETVMLDGPSRVCSLVHQGPTGRLIGGQVAGPGAKGMSAILASAVSARLDLRALAYADLGDSTDISLLQDTARQALRW